MPKTKQRKENRLRVRAIQYLANKLVGLSPSIALNALRANYSPDVFKWNESDVPHDVKGFEDLSFLFWHSPLNRGLIRLDLDEAAALYKIVRSIPNAHGVEIGRFKGGSTVLLASAVGTNGHLLSVDVKPQDDDALKNTLTQMNLSERVELLVSDANEIEYDRDIDFVFIDGDHSYEGAKRDHNRWGAKVRAGGFIIHHDMGNSRPFSSPWKSLTTLKSEITNVQQDVLKLMHEVGSMVIFKRRDSLWKPV